MASLPIMGKGLETIFRVTTGQAASEAGVAYSSDLAEELEAKDSEIGELRRELSRLEKIVEEEFPQGEARELLVEALKKKAEALDKSGNLLDAFHLYRRVLRLAPKDMETLYNIATIYYSADLLGKASECLRMILEIDPGQEKAAESLEEIEGR